MPSITNIRIVDPYVLELIEREQNRTKEGTPTKTAQRMIIERAAQRELRAPEVNSERPAACALEA